MTGAAASLYAEVVWNWLMLTAAMVAATRLLATAKRPAGAAPFVAEPEQDRGWTRGLVIGALSLGGLGLALRLVGFGQSLSGDELGTLWAIEGCFGEVVSRSGSFQGQSPFYYAIVWLFVRLLGESEAVMRLPSLLGVAGAAWRLYKTGALLRGTRAGVYAAAAFWLAFLAFRSSGDARPYGVALFFSALALYGLAKTVQEGTFGARALFIVGAVGLIASHYLLAVLLAGLGLGVLLFPSLRERYSLAKLSMDVAIITVLALPMLSQVLALWGRRGALGWSPEIRLTPIVFAFGPETLLAACAIAAAATLGTGKQRAWFGLLGLAALTPPLVMLATSSLGANLLAERYIAGSLTAMALLAGLALDRVPVRLGVFGWFGWAGLNAMMLLGTYMQAGSFTGAGYQDWRGAVAAVDQDLDREGGRPPVLYRSGFIEDDQRARGAETSPALLAPLRAPGTPAPGWDLVPLTFSWALDRRPEYFDHDVLPAIEDADVFYYFSCDCASGPPSAGYEQRFAKWVDERFPGRYERKAIDAGRGMVAIRFEARESAAVLRPEPRVVGQTPNRPAEVR